jgi:hypothetical protein
MTTRTIPMVLKSAHLASSGSPKPRVTWCPEIRVAVHYPKQMPITFLLLKGLDALIRIDIAAPLFTLVYFHVSCIQ